MTAGGFFEMNDPDDLFRLVEQLRAGEVPLMDVVGALYDILGDKLQPVECTAEYRAALHALGFGTLASAMHKVTMRLGDGTVGVSYQIDKDQALDLDSLDADTRDAMTNAIIFTLRAHDVDADIAEDGRVVLGSGCDDPTHDHTKGRVDESSRRLRKDFGKVISTFTEEIERELGPSVPEPGESRWGRWM